MVTFLSLFLLICLVVFFPFEKLRIESSKNNVLIRTKLMKICTLYENKNFYTTLTTLKRSHNFQKTTYYFIVKPVYSSINLKYYCICLKVSFLSY